MTQTQKCPIRSLPTIHHFTDSETRGLILSKTKAAAFSAILLIIRTVFIKSQTTSGMWSSVQWKSSYYFSTVQELSSSAATLDTASFTGKSRPTSYWRGDFGFKRQRSALVGRTANGVLRNPKLERYWAFLISNREECLISSFFISPHKKKKERCVIHTVKLLWNNASVIIKLPRSLFIHTACKLKRERCLYERCVEKEEIVGFMSEGTLSHRGIRLISHILYIPPNCNILASVQGCLINVCIPKRLLNLHLQKWKSTHFSLWFIPKCLSHFLFELAWLWLLTISSCGSSPCETKKVLLGISSSQSQKSPPLMFLPIKTIL